LVELKTRKFGGQKFYFKDSVANISTANERVRVLKRKGYKKCRITKRKRGLDIWARKNKRGEKI